MRNIGRFDRAVKRVNQAPRTILLQLATGAEAHGDGRTVL
jgi:hypothetical protein